MRVSKDKIRVLRCDYGISKQFEACFLRMESKVATTHDML